MKLTAVLIILLVKLANGEFTEQTQESGLLFAELGKVYTSYTKWHMCYYYDLTPYYAQLQQIGSCVKKMRTICKTLAEQTLCSAVIDQLNIHLDDIDADKYKIDSFHHLNRQKRNTQEGITNKANSKATKRIKRNAPFELIGKIENLLFGVMDADTARQYDEKINELQNNANITKELILEQTSIIKQTTQINQKAFQDFAQTVNDLTEKISELGTQTQDSIHELNSQSKFQSITQITLAIIIKHNKISENLMQLLENAIHGRITSTIPIEQLRQNLKTIEQNLSEDQKLPIDLNSESTYHIYKTVAIKATMLNKRILVEVNVPILERDEYKLIKTIPIPIRVQDTTMIIKPNSEYFLFNAEKMHYIPLPEEELRNCLHNFNNELICTPYSPIHNNRDEVCELETRSISMQTRCSQNAISGSSQQQTT